jgi:hypothetical protein
MKWLVGLAVVLGVGALAFRLWWGPTYSYAYRLTLEIDTPQGPLSASNVYRVTQTPGPDSLSGLNNSGSAPKVTGEAIFADLGAGRNALLLMTHGVTGANVDQFQEMPLWAFDVPAMAAARSEPVHKLVSELAIGTKAELRPDLIPTLITFSDIADPASAKVIFAGGLRQLERFPGTGKHRTEPAVLIDEIAATFGPGFAFRRATIEMVPKGTPVTRGIEKRFSWWDDPAVNKNPGWMSLPQIARNALGLMKRGN